MKKTTTLSISTPGGCPIEARVVRVCGREEYVNADGLVYHEDVDLSTLYVTVERAMLKNCIAYLEDRGGSKVIKYGRYALEIKAEDYETIKSLMNETLAEEATEETEEEATPAEVEEAALKYNAIYNEGGEGYNPFSPGMTRGQYEAARKRVGVSR